MRIQLETGQVIEMDDGATPQQIDEVAMHVGQAQPKAEAPKPDDGFFSRVGQDVNKRANELADNIVAYKYGEKSLPELGLNFIGKAGAGTANDVIGEGMVSGFRALPEGFQSAAKAAGRTVMDSPVGDAIRYAGDQYGQFSAAHPRAASNIESAANIATFIPTAQGISNTAQKAADKAGNTLSKAGDAIYNSGVNSANKARSEFVQNLITPKETPTVLNEQASHAVETGLLRSREVIPTTSEKAVIDEVSKLPVSGNKSLLANRNIIDDAISKEAQSLESSLSLNDVNFPRREFNAQMKQAVGRIAENPMLVGDGEKVAGKIVDKMNSLVAMNKGSASGLLKARKQLDTWVKSQKGSGIFAPDKESAISAALREIRHTTNDFIATKAQNVAVKESLSRQSSLYRALDALDTKVGLEGKNAVTRFIQKGAESLPGKTPLVKAAAAAGIGGGAITSPATTTALGAMYGGYKAATAPVTRKVLGKAISATGQALEGGASGSSLGLLGAAGMGINQADDTAPEAPQVPNTSPQSSNFDNAVNFVLNTEGGYVPDDAGAGPTNRGINSRANPDLNVADMSEGETRQAYLNRYWKPIGADMMPPALALVAFDGAVNQGVGKTKQLLKKSGGDPMKLLQLRKQHYDSLVKLNPKKYGPYYQGWMKRLNDLATQLA